MYRRLLFAVAFLAITVISPNTAIAQCVNPVHPSCGVYDTCFSKLCDCSGSQYEYFTSYGKKYCQIFLDLPGLSQKGMAWRDATLRCLQETIVPLLPPDGQASM